MDAILLAAGNSVRFGENKLLYRLNGKPMYRYMMELLAQQKIAGALEHVIVVTQYEEIFTDVRNHFPGIEAVKNPAPELGISGSIRLGLACLEQVSADSEACLFTVADQPFFTIESLVRAMQLWQAHEGGIIAASAKGRIGNPVIFSAKYYVELKHLEGDEGGKKVLRRHMDDTGLCEVPEGELMDLDTTDAVRVWLKNQETSRRAAVDRQLEGYFPFLKEKNHVISIVGAGGKTTLMDTLARYYARHGCSVVVTTTTHIKRPQSYPVAGNKEELIRMLAAERGVAAGADVPENKLIRTQEAAGGIVAAGADAPENKLTQAEEMTVEDYRDAADIVLVEADGAKHLPCKVPADHEPVIPEETTVVLGVMGLDALGKALHQVCFRKERAMELLGRDAGHCMTEEDLARILASEQGTRKNVGNRAYYIVLNKCDNESQRLQGERIRSLLAKAGITAVTCISLRDINIEERAVSLRYDH